MRLSLVQSAHKNLAIVNGGAITATGSPTTRRSVLGSFEVDFLLTAKQAVLLQNLQKTCTRDFVERLIVPLTLQTYPVSLRTLDWLVTNYCKKKLIYPKLQRTQDMLSEYRKALGFYRRRNFDPFRRSFEVMIRFGNRGDDDFLEVRSTLGQLNFICWAAQHQIIDYALEHKAVIESDMVNSMRKGCSVNKSSKDRAPKRRKLSQEAEVECVVRLQPFSMPLVK